MHPCAGSYSYYTCKYIVDLQCVGFTALWLYNNYVIMTDMYCTIAQYENSAGYREISAKFCRFCSFPRKPCFLLKILPALSARGYSQKFNPAGLLRSGLRE